MAHLFSRHLILSDMEELRQQRLLVENRKDDYRRSADEACYHLDSALRELESFTRDLLDHGIAVIPASLAAIQRTLSIDLMKFAKNIQRQAQRPLVTMAERNQGTLNNVRIWTHWVLTLPVSMNNLVAPLLLQSTPITSLLENNTYYSESELPSAIFHEAHARSWEFTFLTDHSRFGSKAEDVRLGWLGMCREDNLLRGCLNVPPVPVDMSDYR